MMRKADLESEFYRRYERPVIEPYIVGYSGIDPPLRAQSGEEHHEELSGLLGGDARGHYHLTRREYDGVKDMLKWPPEIESGQEVRVTAGEEMTSYEVKGTNVRRTS